MATPRERIKQACARLGERAIALWCADLLAGRALPDGDERLVWLGGVHAEAFLEGREKSVYWPRVWAARALLYAWTPQAGSAVVKALGDESWRVREMALKVVRLREIGEAAEVAADLAGDEMERVRKAAVRALALIGEAEHADAVREMVDDPFVGRDAELALKQMRGRLDRPV